MPAALFGSILLAQLDTPCSDDWSDRCLRFLPTDLAEQITAQHRVLLRHIAESSSCLIADHPWCRPNQYFYSLHRLDQRLFAYQNPLTNSSQDQLLASTTLLPPMARV